MEVVDTRGMRCPWPVLRAARAMRSGQAFVLIADDPIARRDVPELAESRGWIWTVTETPTDVRFILSQGETPAF